MIGIDFNKAADILNDGGLIAFPTETVFGLGVIFNDHKAYKKLNKVKGKREEKPYTMMMANKEEIYNYAEVDDTAKKIIDAFVPGQVTLLLKAKDNVPSYVTHNTGVVGVRVPSNLMALTLLKLVGKPLLVPSANRSNMPPLTDAKSVEDEFKNDLDYILDGEVKSGVPSTIIDLTDGVKIIRQGVITLEDINKVIGEE